MTTRLQKIDLTSFVGGLNLREGQLQLSETESPSMQNMEIDPRSGFFTRYGWGRWNAADISSGTWDPRHAQHHTLSDGTSQHYITNEAEVYAAAEDGNFGTDAPLGVPCNAIPHLADFAKWGDTIYMATGRNAAIVGGAPTKRVSINAPVALADASLNFNDDYTNPAAGLPAMPFADFAEAHAGYLFVASTNEAVGGEQPNRLRWSHPDAPEAWAALDFLDIEIGGGRITGIRSFQDHLAIFKTDSVWALYGYDLESWQLINVSRAIGAPTTTAIARSENEIFFASSSGRNGIYRYDGRGLMDLSDPIETALEEMTQFDDIWIGWVGRRLWCSMPWNFDDGPAGFGVFIYDPYVGEGAWTFCRPAAGDLRCIIENSDIGNSYPLAVLGNSGTTQYPLVLQLDFNEAAAADTILNQVDLIPFETWYRTAWQHAGWPELRKSWLRARWIARRGAQQTDVRVDIFKDYEESSPARSTQGTIGVDGSVFFRELGFDDPLGNGFDFSELGAADPSGRGADFSGGSEGAQLGRTPMGYGPARAIQIQVCGCPGDTLGQPWAIDAIFFKLVFRRFTT